MREEYFQNGKGVKSKFLSTSKYDERTPGLFKLEFQGTRMIALTSKCYFAENQIDNKTKVSCKGVSRKQNEISWKRYMNALDGSKDMAQNTGFRIIGNQMATYTQNKLGSECLL